MAAIFQETDGSKPNICFMNAFTVSSDGSRVLKAGTGGGASFDLVEVFWATANETSNHPSEQHSNKRRMRSFREPEFLKPIKTVVTRSSWPRLESGDRS